jgi:hypothetical protein
MLRHDNETKKMSQIRSLSIDGAFLSQQEKEKKKRREKNMTLQQSTDCRRQQRI